MKKILLLMGFCCTVSLVNAQSPDHGFQDSHHNTLGTIRNTSIYNNENKLIGQFAKESGSWTIKNGQNQAVGYILRNEYQDASHNTIGYAQVDRTTSTWTIEDGTHKVLGYIKPGGIVENSAHTVIGYDVMTEPIWGAAYFFFVKF